MRNTGHRAFGFLAGLQVSVEIVVQVFAGRGRLLGFSFATATSATATTATSTSARGSPSRPSLAAAAGAKRFSDSAAGAESQNGTTVRTVMFFYTLVSAVLVCTLLDSTLLDSTKILSHYFWGYCLSVTITTHSDCIWLCYFSPKWLLQLSTNLCWNLVFWRLARGLSKGRMVASGPSSLGFNSSDQKLPFDEKNIMPFLCHYYWLARWNDKDIKPWEKFQSEKCYT